jgi:hypothetical protein
MIRQDELRIGNMVYWNPHFSHSNIGHLVTVEIAALLPDKVGYIRSHMEHRVEPFEDDMITKEIPFTSYEELEPIPLTESAYKNIKIKYPDLIQFVHELQNWYFWANGKKEVENNSLEN